MGNVCVRAAADSRQQGRRSSTPPALCRCPIMDGHSSSWGMLPLAARLRRGAAARCPSARRILAQTLRLPHGSLLASLLAAACTAHFMHCTST